MRPALLAVLMSLALAGCIRSADDPDKVAHEFSEALINGQPGSALLYTPTASRADESFRRAMESDSKKLAPCKQEKHDYQMTVVNDDKRLYRVVFGNYCGAGGLVYTDLALRIEKVDGRWIVTDYAPQVFIAL